MESVTIIASVGTKASRFSTLLDGENWQIEERSADDMLIQLKGERAYLIRDDHLMQEYDDSEIEKVLDLVPNPIFFSLEFSNLALAKLIINLIADASDLAVDDTHGTILRGSEFTEKIRTDPTWNWLT